MRPAMPSCARTLSVSLAGQTRHGGVWLQGGPRAGLVGVWVRGLRPCVRSHPPALQPVPGPVYRRGRRAPCCCVNRLCKGLCLLTPLQLSKLRLCIGGLIGRAVWQLKDVSTHCEAAWKPSHVSPKDKGTQVFEMQKYFDPTTSFFKGKK